MPSLQDGDKIMTEKKIFCNGDIVDIYPNPELVYLPEGFYREVKFIAAVETGAILFETDDKYIVLNLSAWIRIEKTKEK